MFAKRNRLGNSIVKQESAYNPRAYMLYFMSLIHIATHTNMQHTALHWMTKIWTYYTYICMVCDFNSHILFYIRTVLYSFKGILLAIRCLFIYVPIHSINVVISSINICLYPVWILCPCPSYSMHATAYLHAACQAFQNAFWVGLRCEPAHLKGQCHETFECWFFQHIASPGPIRGSVLWDDLELLLPSFV